MLLFMLLKWKKGNFYGMYTRDMLWQQLYLLCWCIDADDCRSGWGMAILQLHIRYCWALVLFTHGCSIPVLSPIIIPIWYKTHGVFLGLLGSQNVSFLGAVTPLIFFRVIFTLFKMQEFPVNPSSLSRPLIEARRWGSRREVFSQGLRGLEPKVTWTKNLWGKGSIGPKVISPLSSRPWSFSALDYKVDMPMWSLFTIARQLFPQMGIGNPHVTWSRHHVHVMHTA